MIIMKKHFRLGLLVLLSLSLSACLKSNPPVKTERYTLPEVTASQAAASSVTGITKTLVLNRIQLADYLDSDRIVVQTDDITMQPARDHLWVDNLSQELRRGLRTRLATRLQDTVVVDPLPGSAAVATNLHVTIDQFHGNLQGYAVISGQWRLVSASQAELHNQTFKFTTPLNENGYPALVRALGADLDLLSDQIANQLQKSH